MNINKDKQKKVSMGDVQERHATTNPGDGQPGGARSKQQDLAANEKDNNNDKIQQQNS